MKGRLSVAEQTGRRLSQHRWCGRAALRVGRGCRTAFYLLVPASARRRDDADCGERGGYRYELVESFAAELSFSCAN